MSQSTTIHPDLLAQKDQMEQRLSEQIIMNDLKAIHSIYFDLPLLQEVYIGALLLLAKTEEEYNHILSRIPIYLARVDTDICKYFQVDHTDEEIREYIKDPEHAELLYKASPHTNLWFFFPTLYGALVENNRVTAKLNNNYTVYVNVHTVGYTPTVCRVMAHHFALISKHIQFKTIHKPFTELPFHIRTSPELYFMEKVGDIFSTESPAMLDVYEHNAYDNKFVFGRKLITNNEFNESLDASFITSKHFLNIFTTFDYIDISIPGVDYVTPITDEEMS